MADTKITQQQFDHIAKLSRLTIGPDEQFIADQLSDAAKSVEVLNNLDIGTTPPTFQVNHKKNVFRDDVITPSIPQNVAIGQAPKTHQGFVVTAATIKK